MRTVTPAFLLLAACGADPAAGVEGIEGSEAALAATDEAIEVSLVSIEAASSVGAAGASQGGACPEVSWEGGLSEFTLSADYGAGCTPDSGLITQELSGAVSLSYADQVLTVELDELSTAESSVDGVVSGSYERAGGALILELEGALAAEIEGQGLAVEERLLSEVGATELSLDGWVDITRDDGSAPALELDGLRFRYADLAGACPLPYAGVVTAEVDGQVVVITFDADSPSTGEVTVSAGRASQTANLCAG